MYILYEDKEWKMHVDYLHTILRHGFQLLRGPYVSKHETLLRCYLVKGQHVGQLDLFIGTKTFHIEILVYYWLPRFKILRHEKAESFYKDLKDTPPDITEFLSLWNEACKKVDKVIALNTPNMQYPTPDIVDKAHAVYSEIMKPLQRSDYR
jgi:hypothetical protein